MTDNKFQREIVVRGLIPNDRGKSIEIDGKTYLLRGFEHEQDETVLTVVTSIRLPHRKVVRVND